MLTKNRLSVTAKYPQLSPFKLNHNALFWTKKAQKQNIRILHFFNFNDKKGVAKCIKGCIVLFDTNLYHYFEFFPEDDIDDAVGDIGRHVCTSE